MIILNSVDIISANHNTIFIVLFILGAILSGTIAVLGFALEEYDSGIFFGFITVMLIFSAASATMDRSYEYTKIEATIDETVSAVELLDKYEVLDHRGDIYELKYVDPEKTGEKE